MRAALIDQHRSAQRDKMLADGISARVSAELPGIGHEPLRRDGDVIRASAEIAA